MNKKASLVEIWQPQPYLAEISFSFCGNCNQLIKTNLNLYLPEEYCSFCRRHNYQKNRQVFQFSFDPIISDYSNKLYQSEITDMVESCITTGMQHAAFNYNSDTNQWFLDLKKPINYNELIKTIINMLLCFNLYVHIPDKAYLVVSYYKNKLSNFYHNIEDNQDLVL